MLVLNLFVQPVFFGLFNFHAKYQKIRINKQKLYPNQNWQLNANKNTWATKEAFGNQIFFFFYLFLDKRICLSFNKQINTQWLNRQAIIVHSLALVSHSCVNLDHSAKGFAWKFRAFWLRKFIRLCMNLYYFLKKIL